MPRRHPHPPHLAPAPSKASQSWEPARSQLRALDPVQLDPLVHAWLEAQGCTDVHRDPDEEYPALYQALLPLFDSPIPMALRLYQRRSRLQEHHVEAFAGFLARQGSPFGILLTTGGCTDEAVQLADCSRLPHVRLYSGEEWLADLAARRIGIERRSLPQWVLSLPARLRSTFRAALRKVKPLSGRRRKA